MFWSVLGALALWDGLKSANVRSQTNDAPSGITTIAEGCYRKILYFGHGGTIELFVDSDVGCDHDLGISIINKKDIETWKEHGAVSPRFVFHDAVRNKRLNMKPFDHTWYLIFENKGKGTLAVSYQVWDLG